MPSQFFGDNHDSPSFEPSSVSMSTSMEIAFDHSFCIRLLLLGSQGGASSSEASPDSMDCWNWYTKLGPFFASSFDCNFQPNDNQTFTVYAKKYTSTIQKGPMWFFSGFGIRSGTKVMWSKVLPVLQTRGSTICLVKVMTMIKTIVNSVIMVIYLLSLQIVLAIYYNKAWYWIRSIMSQIPK